MIPTAAPSSFPNTSCFPFTGNHGGGSFDFLCRPLESAGMMPRLSQSSAVTGGLDQKKRFRTACKARGVAGDHNPTTAYLLVPENAPHGYILHCSHALCVRTGRQFRYCAYCCQPVAKRNFHTRHNHGLIKYEDGRPIIPADEIFSSEINPFRSPRTASSNESRSLKRAPSPVPSKEQVSKKSKREQTAPVPPKVIVVSDNETNSIKSDLPCSQESTLSTEEEAWIKLFHERPRSATPGDASLKKWLASMLKLTFPDQNLGSAVLSFPSQDGRGESGGGVLEDIDSVLGDFDKDLQDYQGDWNIEAI